MKTLLAILTLALLFSCSSTKKAEETTSAIANPFSEFSLLSEAENAASFDVTLPDLEGYTLKVYRVIEGELLEVIYEGEGEIRIRKAVGDSDVSGDYNTYSKQRMVARKGRTILLEGEDDKVYKATWSDSGYSYSITSDKGIEENFLIQLTELTI